MHNLQTMANSNTLIAQCGLSSNSVNSRSDFTMAMDFNQLLIRQSNSTHVLQITGHAHADYGILDGDIVVIDRALQAGSNDLLVTGQGREARMLRQHQLTPDDTPWGVVTAIIHQYR